MDGVVREVNTRMLVKELQLLRANGDRFEINQLLFPDDTTLLVDSCRGLVRLVNKFGRTYEEKS